MLHDSGSTKMTSQQLGYGPGICHRNLPIHCSAIAAAFS